MGFDIRELNDANCKTYLLVSQGKAALIDPVRERVPAYLAVLEEAGLSLELVLETHLHADHLMITRDMLDHLGAPYVMHERSPSPLVSKHVLGGELFVVGDEEIRVLDTPGHTPDSVCYAVDGAVFTGDTLLIGGSGRCDFPGGDAGQQYDGVHDKLFCLPDDTVVWPGHDYRGNTSTTIAREKAENPRLAGKSRDDYIRIMANLNLPFPERIQEALQVNQSGVEAAQVVFPALADVAAAATVTPAEAHDLFRTNASVVVIDVREPEEFVGELGHIAGALLVPLDSLQARLPKLVGYAERDVIVVCRAGARSASACVMLTAAGFQHVRNLSGGMLSWQQCGYPVER